MSRKRQTQLIPLGEILFSAVKRRGMTEKFQENFLRKLWPEVVGEQVNAKTQPDSFKNGILFVRTVSSVWVQQLHFMRDEIRDKLNELSGKPLVKDIRFQVGYRLDKEKYNSSSTGKTFLKKRDREMIAQCTENLADRELANILQRVMQLEISFRRRMEQEKAH